MSVLTRRGKCHEPEGVACEELEGRIPLKKESCRPTSLR